MTTRIPLAGGLTAIVDDEDAHLAGVRWCAHADRNKTYAVRVEVMESVQVFRLLHREILNAPEGIEVDHINGDGLDNRRANLRLATRAQNQWNSGRRSDNTSGFKGVGWVRSRQRWQAKIKVRGLRIFLGYHASPEAAAQAYDAAARQHFGEFARLNFPSEHS